jgi:Protein of unknown function (DUF4236)
VTIRFFRRVTLLPGLGVNLSKSGASMPVGTRGAWLTIGPRGQRASTGIRGTGVWWTEQILPAAAPHAGHRATFGLAIILLALAAVFWLFLT